MKIGLGHPLVLAFVLFTAPVAAQQDEATDVRRHSRTVVLGGLSGVPPTAIEYALSQLHGRRQTDIVPTLILALRYNRQAAEPLVAVLSAMTGETEARTWFDWMLWQEAHPEIAPHPSFPKIKHELLTSLDPNFGRFIPLGPDAAIRVEEVVWGGVAVDGIPALTNPAMIPAAEADYLIPGELVFGIEIGGDARAYPLRILDWHEMLNDVIGGVPVSLAYCTLCGAGILFETAMDDGEEPFTFGSSGLLYRSNKLMFDRQTGSLWNQFTGRPVSGPLAAEDIELPIRPVEITSWRDWAGRHPETTVLSLDTGHARDYAPGAAYAHYFNSPDLMFPALAEDAGGPLKDYVFGIRTAGGAKAWPLKNFRDGSVVNDTVGLVDVVLIGREMTRTVRAYRRDGRTFEPGREPETLLSGGETWRVGDDALTGPGGEKLPRVAGHVAFRFAWAAFVQ